MQLNNFIKNIYIQISLNHCNNNNYEGINNNVLYKYSTFKFAK